jgi:Trypsin-like peptidase domain/TPM domain
MTRAPHLLLGLGLFLLAPTLRADDDGARVYQKTLKSVAWIHSPRGQGKLATGTGSLIDRKHRLILTNYHVVGDGNRVTVLFPSYDKGKLIAERDYYLDRIKRNGIRGKVVARDMRRDLALIQLEELPEGVEPLPLAPTSVSPGQAVHSLGNPGGSGALWVYTPGKVRQVYYKKWKAELDGKAALFEAEVVETDSATNPGDSGGPLVNDQAQLVGVTQGGAVNARLLSTFIDVSEVKLFLGTRDVRGVTDNDLAPAHTALARVQDDAHFFSEEAVKKAAEEIRDLAKKYDRDLVIETIPTLTEEDLKRVGELKGEEREKFFQALAEARMKKAGILDGMYLVMWKTPGHLRIVVPERARKVFDVKSTEKFLAQLLTLFRAKKFDDGLDAAVKFAREKLSEAGKP